MSLVETILVGVTSSQKYIRSKAQLSNIFVVVDDEERVDDNSEISRWHSVTVTVLVTVTVANEPCSEGEEELSSNEDEIVELCSSGSAKSEGGAEVISISGRWTADGPITKASRFFLQEWNQCGVQIK